LGAFRHTTLRVFIDRTSAFDRFEPSKLLAFMEGNGGHPLSAPQAEETPLEAPPPYESFIEERDEEEDKVSET